jgi:hypothetical protein
VPYIGGSLKGLAEAVAEVTPVAARNLCEAGSEGMLERAIRYTPVRSGAVRDAWLRTAVERYRGRAGFDAYESRVQNDHWRANWAEWGTGPHRIEPDDERAIETPEGPRAGADHPGYPGAHMASRAAHEVEAEFPALAQDELQAWAKAAEANAWRRPGIR